MVWCGFCRMEERWRLDYVEAYNRTRNSSSQGIEDDRCVVPTIEKSEGGWSGLPRITLGLFVCARRFAT